MKKNGDQLETLKRKARNDRMGIMCFDRGWAGVLFRLQGWGAGEGEKMNTTGQPGPLARAIAQQSAEWLEASYPMVFDALGKELEAGHTLNDVRRILRRIFGNELRDAFVLRVLQAAEFMCSEQVH